MSKIYALVYHKHPNSFHTGMLNNVHQGLTHTHTQTHTHTHTHTHIYIYIGVSHQHP